MSDYDYLKILFSIPEDKFSLFAAVKALFSQDGETTVILCRTQRSAKECFNRFCKCLLDCEINHQQLTVKFQNAGRVQFMVVDNVLGSKSRGLRCSKILFEESIVGG